MEFTSLTEQEIRELNLLEEGRYKGTVLRTEHKVSRNGRDYFNLKIRISLPNKKEKIVYDMLFFEGKMIFKTKHFCEGTGLTAQYKAGKLMPFECDGKEFECDIVNRPNQVGEMQSGIKDYVVVEEEAFNDDIPFGNEPVQK